MCTEERENVQTLFNDMISLINLKREISVI
jgi:hypothetical protein